MFPRFQWQVYRTLGTAAALEHEPAIPIRRRRQAHLEAVAIGIAIDTDTFVDNAVDLAVGRQRYAIR